MYMVQFLPNPSLLGLSRLISSMYILYFCIPTETFIFFLIWQGCVPVLLAFLAGKYSPTPVGGIPARMNQLLPCTTADCRKENVGSQGSKLDETVSHPFHASFLILL